MSIIVNKDNRVHRFFKPLALMSSCTYIHVSCHKESLLHTSLCFKTLPNIIIIIFHVKNKELLLHSITVNAKSSKKMKGDK